MLRSKKKNKFEIEASSIRADINITPLVDVVLVLLIIFMVVAPMLGAGPPVQLPQTEKPPTKPEDQRELVFSVDQDGYVWMEDRKIEPRDFVATLQDAAQNRNDRDVVIKGDARLTYGKVKQTLLAVKAAGFTRVGLIADQQGEM